MSNKVFSSAAFVVKVLPRSGSPPFGAGWHPWTYVRYGESAYPYFRAVMYKLLPDQVWTPTAPVDVLGSHGPPGSADIFPKYAQWGIRPIYLAGIPIIGMGLHEGNTNVFYEALRELRTVGDRLRDIED